MCRYDEHVSSSYLWRLGILDKVWGLISYRHPYAATVKAAIQSFDINIHASL